MITTDQLPWTDSFLVGYSPMDDIHREFVDLVDAMLGCAPVALSGYLQQLIVHSEEHFAQEQEWMAKTSFPATECHTNEHNAVLQSMRDVQAYIADGGAPDEARRLATELARWFPGHTDYLDASLAQWVSKQQSGGVPVVLRRGAAQHDLD